MLCTAWPVPTGTPTPPERTGPPPLVLGTEADPRTPLSATKRVAASLRDVTLVSWLGAAHGAFPGTPCVGDAVAQYLLEGDLPRQGKVCPP